MNRHNRPQSAVKVQTAHIDNEQSVISEAQRIFNAMLEGKACAATVEGQPVQVLNIGAFEITDAPLFIKALGLVIATSETLGFSEKDLSGIDVSVTDHVAICFPHLPDACDFQKKLSNAADIIRADFNHYASPGSGLSH